MLCTSLEWCGGDFGKIFLYFNILLYYISSIGSIILRFNYNDEGCLPHSVYSLSLKEFEGEFVKGKSQKRQDIFRDYKTPLIKLKIWGVV